MTHHQLTSQKLISFPRLVRRNHRVTSAETDTYNCIAWAAGDTTRWWWPRTGYWPAGTPDDPLDVGSFIAAYASLGYVVCADGALEEGFEKIAIFVHPNGFPTHAALQLETGYWTSKLGTWEDIEHTSEHDVEGNCQFCYGDAHTYMRRSRAT